jgi:hypothetical protein
VRDATGLFLFFNKINHADMFLSFYEALFEDVLQTDEDTLLAWEQFIDDMVHMLFNYGSPMSTKRLLTFSGVDQAAKDLLYPLANYIDEEDSLRYFIFEDYLSPEVSALP